MGDVIEQRPRCSQSATITQVINQAFRQHLHTNLNPSVCRPLESWLTSKESRSVRRGTIGKVPVGATRWWSTLLQARFWNSGERDDSPTDCSGMWQFQLLPLSTHHDTILSKKAAALVVKSNRSRTFASSCVATKAAMPGRPDR